MMKCTRNPCNRKRKTIPTLHYSAFKIGVRAVKEIVLSTISQISFYIKSVVLIYKSENEKSSRTWELKHKPALGILILREYLNETEIFVQTRERRPTVLDVALRCRLAFNFCAVYYIITFGVPKL